MKAEQVKRLKVTLGAMKYVVPVVALYLFIASLPLEGVKPISLGTQYEVAMSGRNYLVLQVDTFGQVRPDYIIKAGYYDSSIILLRYKDVMDSADRLTHHLAYNTEKYLLVIKAEKKYHDSILLQNVPIIYPPLKGKMITLEHYYSDRKSVIRF